MRYKNVLFISAVSILLAVMVRTVQLFMFTESKTGFIILDKQPVGYLISAFIIVLVAISFAIGFTVRRHPTHIPKVKADISIVSIALAIGFAGEALTAQFASNVPNVLVFIFRIAGVCAAAVMAWYGIDGILQKELFRPGFFAVVIVFLFFRLVACFSNFAAVSCVVDTIIDISLLCSSLVFFLFFGKFSCRIEQKHIGARILSVSFLTICCCALNVVPHILAYITSNGDLVHSGPDGIFTNLCIGVFTTLYTFHLFDRKNLPVKHHASHMMRKSASDISNNSFYIDK